MGRQKEESRKQAEKTAKKGKSIHETASKCKNPPTSIVAGFAIRVRGVPYHAELATRISVSGKLLASLFISSCKKIRNNHA
jgi:hypothetical protein